MAGELNTEVRSDPPSCRATADWLGTLSPEVSGAGSAIVGARGASEASWEGAAGDAFRAAMGPLSQDADELVGIIDRVRAALSAFAGEIDTVISQMTQARGVATAAQLIVTPTAILPPGPGPGAAPTPPTGAVTPAVQGQYADAAAAHEAAAAAHAAKAAAFEEARATVDAARVKETDAHRTLDGAMASGSDMAATLRTVGTATVGAGLSYVQGFQNEADDLLRRAGQISDHGARMQALALDPTSTPAARTAAQRAADLAGSGETRTRAGAERMLRPISAIPEPVRVAIGGSPADWIKNGNTWSKLGKSALKGVPWIGTTATLAGAGGELAAGKPVGQVAAETGAGVGGGVAGGMLGAGIGTAIFPGVGTVVGGVIGSVIGSMTATEVVSQAYED